MGACLSVSACEGELCCASSTRPIALTRTLSAVDSSAGNRSEEEQSWRSTLRGRMHCGRVLSPPRGSCGLCHAGVELCESRLLSASLLPPCILLVLVAQTHTHIYTHTHTHIHTYTHTHTHTHTRTRTQKHINIQTNEHTHSIMRTLNHISFPVDHRRGGFLCGAVSEWLWA
jgi:hypothetical protein